MDTPEGLAELRLLIDDGIRYARAMEVCLGALGFLPPLIDSISRMVEVDPDVAPELRVAIEHLNETHLALSRAAKFLGVKFEVRMGIEPE